MLNDYPSDRDKDVLRGVYPDHNEIREYEDRLREAARKAPRPMQGYYRLAFAIIDESCPF